MLAEGVAHRVEIFGKPEFSARLIRIYDGQQTLAPAQRFTLRAQVTPFGTVSIDSTPGGTVFVDGQVDRYDRSGLVGRFGVIFLDEPHDIDTMLS